LTAREAKAASSSPQERAKLDANVAAAERDDLESRLQALDET